MSNKESQLLLFKAKKKKTLFRSLAVSIEGRIIITAFEEIVQMQEMKYFIYMLEGLHTENKIHLKIREEHV